MENKKKNFWRDAIIIGLALFSTMFGAGNLIFPPQIGLFSGDAWVTGAIGLLLSGIILPVLALWAVNNVGQDCEDLMGHITTWFYKVFFFICCTLIAVGSTLPRSAATTYEIGIQPLFPNVPNWVVCIIFFALVYFFACDKDSVIDKLGKYLTPLLLLLLVIVLVKGVIMPIGTPIDTGITNPFSKSMLTAYNTGDLTVGILFAGVILGDFKRRGYTNAERKKGGIVAGVVCIVVLFAIYGTLTYLGACGSASYPQDTAQTALLAGIIRDVLGNIGLGLLGGAVALACLTTAIGIGTLVVTFFHGLFKEKISYRILLLIVCVISILMAITGVQNIINYVTPIFLVVYPMCIVMTALGLLNKFLPNDGIYIGGVFAAGFVSLGDAILSCAPGLTWLQGIMSSLPFSSIGFSWLVPSIIGMIIGGFICKGRAKYQALESEA